VFLKGTTINPHMEVLGRIVRKPVSANPGLNVNQSIPFLCTKMFSIDYVLRSLRFFKLKPEGKTISTGNCTQKFQT